MRASAAAIARARAVASPPLLPTVSARGARPLSAAAASTTTTANHPGAELVPDGTPTTTTTATALAVAERLRALDAAATATLVPAGIDGVGKLRSRIRRDLKRLLARPGEAAAGARNNARGYTAELAVARHAPPPVVAVCASATGGGQGQQGSVEVDVVCDGGATWIEVKAHRPFSTASHHWTGGSGKRRRGLKEQAEALLAAAQDPSNAARGFCAPRLAVLFSRGVDPSVARELERMGAIALGEEKGGDGQAEEDDDDDDDASIDAACRAALAALPPLPARTGPPPPVNLDVTAMCALVSEVSWSGGGGEENAATLDRWASRTTHWRECLAAERAEPLLFSYEGIEPLTRRRRWRADLALARAGRRLLGGGEEEDDDHHQPPQAVLASAAAVRQFESLAALHAGPREAQRWARLRAGLEVVGVGVEAAAASGAPSAATAETTAIATTTAAATGLALSVLSLGGTRRAVTVTANGAAVRSAREHWARRRQSPARRRGPTGGGGGGGGGEEEGGWTDDAAAGALEVEVHRAVWLAGM